MPLLSLSQIKAPLPWSTDLALNIPKFTLEPGQIIGLGGPRSPQKSIFLNIISGHTHRYDGTYTFDSIPDAKTKEIKAARRQHLSIIDSTMILIPSMTLSDNIKLANHLSGTPESEFTESTLKKLDLNAHLNMLPDQIPNYVGQKTRLAQAFAKKPKLIIALDPFFSLTPYLSAMMARLLINLCKDSNTALLLASDTPGTLSLLETVLIFDQLNTL